MPPDQYKPCQRPGIIHHDVLDEVVVYCSDTQLAVSLNESASVIWDLCDGSRTIEEICAELSSQAGLNAAQLRDDVRNAVDRLYELDLLTREPV